MGRDDIFDNPRHIYTYIQVLPEMRKQPTFAPSNGKSEQKYDRMNRYSHFFTTFANIRLSL